MDVAPRVGAWIETFHVKPFKYFNYGRSPRGSVD